jgi:NAD(P)-dependent dehydrogenase (short-subunit alcohol dehydrogenase family)
MVAGDGCQHYRLLYLRWRRAADDARGRLESHHQHLVVDGITTNAVLPGMIETEMENIGRTDESRQHVIGNQCLKRQQTPEDMLGTLLFLPPRQADL